MATAALPEKGPYTELAGFAQLRSLPYAGAAELVFGAAPAWVSLSLSIDSGRVCGLSVEVGGRAHPEVQELTKKFENSANELATAKEAEVMGG